MHLALLLDFHRFFWGASVFVFTGKNSHQSAFSHWPGTCLNQHLWVLWSAGEPGSCFRCPGGINGGRPWHFNEGQEEQSAENMLFSSHQATNKGFVFLRWKRHGYLLQAENTPANMSAWASAPLPSCSRSFCRQVNVKHNIFLRGRLPAASKDHIYI